MQGKRLLYLTCHPWLERSDYRIFSELGFEVFSTGYFRNPSDPSSPFVDPLPYKANADILRRFEEDNLDYSYGYNKKLNLSREFLQEFDVIVVSWRYDYLVEILPVLSSHHLLLFQTVGQSDPSREKQLSSVRSSQVKIIRMSEGERNFPCYAGEDAIIDLSVDTERFNKWGGHENYILTVNKMMWRTRECNVDYYLSVTRGLPRKLFGTDNEAFKQDFSLGPISPNDLIKAYSEARLCFCLGTKPCPVVMGFKEALASGCPVVTWGPKLGDSGYGTYSAYKFIENGQNGFYSDNLQELRSYVELLLNDHQLAMSLSAKAIETARINFSIEAVKERWEQFFKREGL